VIHERILDVLKVKADDYPKQRVYAILFYNSDFRSFGNGIFGLSEWETTTQAVTGESIFQVCPQPFLGINGKARSFFESLMVGLDLLRQHPQMSARQFYAEIHAWDNREDLDLSKAQGAFDAWYAAGLIQPIDYTIDANKPLVLAISPELKLKDIRINALNTICRCILKMPELLLTIEKIAPATNADIQRILFGSADHAFDLANRLTLLEAFEAIRREDSGWVITATGQSVLANHPPAELPDFGEIEQVESLHREDPVDEYDDWSWEDEIDLLEF
jgi:hypothetical protein